MECKYCKSKWDSELQTSQCPFCGRSLLHNTEEITSLSEGIAHIINEYGVDVLSESKRLTSLVMDYVSGCEKDKKLFRIALSNGISSTIIKMLQVEDSSQREMLSMKAIKSLEEDVFLSEENAYHIFNIFLTGASLPNIVLETSISESDENNTNVQSETSSIISTEKIERFNSIRSKISVTDHSVVLSDNGTVLAIGANESGQCSTSHWRDVTAICCKVSHTYGLRSDGTVLAAGQNNHGQCNVSN